MRKKSSVVAAGCGAALIASAMAVATVATAADRPDVRDLAKEGMERRDSTTITPFERPKYDADKVKALADEAQARSRVELQALIEQHGGPKADEEGESKPVKLQGRMLVALSSSMPEQMLRDYFAQLDGHPEAVVVLRGFVGGAQRVGPTGQLMERLMRKTSDRAAGHHAVEVLVDPLLFRQLGIDKVPAVAWLHGVEDIGHCDQEDYDAAVVVYGATTVGAAMKAAREKGASVPADFVERLGGRS